MNINENNMNINERKIEFNLNVAQLNNKITEFNKKNSEFRNQSYIKQVYDDLVIEKNRIIHHKRNLMIEKVNLSKLYVSRE